MKYIFIILIKIYQFTISPLIGSNCRFSPTCSNYCIQALQKHGTLKGLFLSFKRIISCHPWGRSGHDPV